MLSAVFWIVLFIIVLVAVMYVREQVRNNVDLQTWYQQTFKGRLDLFKKIIVYGTLFLWIAIWAATRGDDKASFGSLMNEISNSWKAPEEQTIDAQ